MFASAKTTFGDLPPSSSEIFFRLPEAACMIVLPTAVEPVNATLSTFGDAASSAPTTAPGAGDDVDHAGGRAGLA